MQFPKLYRKPWGFLETNGRICVISFHSLEDRIVKKEVFGIRGKRLRRIIRKNLFYRQMKK